MKEYEVIWEIFNKCPNNQMRDVFVDEIEVLAYDAPSKVSSALLRLST